MFLAKNDVKKKLAKKKYWFDEGAELRHTQTWNIFICMILRHH